MATLFPIVGLLISLSKASIISALPRQCQPLMPTPSYGTDGAVFNICSNLTIAASVEEVYDVLADFGRYHLWNSFVYAVELPANVTCGKDDYVGLTMTFHTTGLLPTNTTSIEEVTVLEPGKKEALIAWKSDTNLIEGLLYQAEHPSLLFEVEGGTRYVSWETSYQAGAVVEESIKDNLQKEFEIEGADLKRWVEGWR